MKDSVRFNMLLPKSFYRALQKLATKRETSVAQLVRDAIYQFLKAAGVLCVLFIVGCGGSSGGASQEEYYSKKINDWKSREAKAPTIETECYVSGNVRLDIIHTINEISNEIAYRREEGNYWKTSNETITDGFGDCEDLAAVAYRVLSDSCLVETYDLDVRMRVIDIPDKTSNHVIAVAYTSNSFFEIDNLVVIEHERNHHVIAEFYLF